MEKIKKIMTFLVIIVIICVFLILILSRNTKLKQIQEAEKEIPDLPEDFIEELKLVEGYSTFFSVEKMLNQYLEAIYNSDGIAIYNIMDNTYISNNNVTNENVLEYVSEIEKYSQKAKVKQIYEQRNANNSEYYIEAILQRENERKEFYFTLYQDERNFTYSIEKIEKQAYDNLITDTTRELEPKEIEKNDNNRVVFIEVSEEKKVTRYLEDFLENIIYYPEYAYTLLDNEYKEKVFPTYQEFEEYVNNNREMFKTYFQKSLKSSEEFENMDEYMAYVATAQKLQLEEYQIRMKDEYNKYTCLDSEGNYYIFYAVAPLQYTVMLDNYTIPTEDFIEAYNASEEAEKVVLNIKKFFMGIEDKNYGYAYNLLAESFRNNKYPTKNDFITYVEQNFFEQNKIEYVNYTKETGLYVYKIKISDATGKNTETKQFNMIIKLKEGTDFEMSFSEI